MKLAIVGSRNFTNQKELDDIVDAFVLKHGMLPELVVSGGAKGADTLAHAWARKHNVSIKIFKPDWKTKGKAAGVLRNTDIVNECTHMIAFPSKDGKGTQDSIKKAQAKGIPIEIHWK
ncbi:MAG: DUF2493 domain-containing protein [Nitrosomonas sp.]|nr:DUF2493 domain-containing protein [Nitrosomonas sp.]